MASCKGQRGERKGDPRESRGRGTCRLHRSSGAAPGREALRAAARAGGRVRVIAGLRETAAGKAPEARAAQSLRVATDVLAEEAAAAVRYDAFPLVALTVTPEQLSRLEQHPDVAFVEEDRLRRPMLTSSVALIGGAAAHAAGHKGAGQAVAILDTGVDAGHPFLAGAVVAEACFSTTYAGHQATTVCPNGAATQTGPGAAAACGPACWHGTHVAGIAAGRSVSMNGVAPAAQVLAVQVFSRLNDAASCSPNAPPCYSAYDSDIIRGMDWVYAQRAAYAVAAVNLSLGGDLYALQSACDADNRTYLLTVNKLRAAGIATVAASGNDGSSTSISAPACVSTAVAVGATNTSDVVQTFSNTHPMLDVLAPGASIRSSLPGGSYGNAAGTSMAAPHVAGAFAVLKARFPAETVDQLLARITTGGVRITESRTGLTFPRLHVDRALRPVGWLGLSAESGTLAAGASVVITATLEAGALATGAYGATLGFTSNATVGPPNVSVPIALQIVANPEPVWPGDANHDGSVNHLDILPIGTHYKRTGAARLGAGGAWTEQIAEQWATPSAARADADGNGIVDYRDVLLIGANWGRTHGVGGAGKQAHGGAAAAGALRLHRAGETVEVRAEGVGGLRALAFEVRYDAAAYEIVDVEDALWMGPQSLRVTHAAGGRLYAGMTLRRGDPALNGGGVALRFRLRPLGAGAPPPELALADVLAVTDDAETAVPLAAEEAAPLPLRFGIEGNYPNPFNPETTIRYALEQTALVRLEIYDVAGRRVRVLESGLKAAGLYTARWDGRDEAGLPVASGAYLARLVQGARAATRPLLLIK